MPGTETRPNCLTHAAHWRQRSLATGHVELREAYERLADSYEQLAQQSQLCQRVVAAAACRRGEALPCRCMPGGSPAQ